MRFAAAGITAATVVAVAAPRAEALGGTGQTAALQVALRATGYYVGDVDGLAGPGTRSALQRFQRRNGLAPDGIPGPRTRSALGRRGRPGFGTRPLRLGMSGWDVAALQFLLARAGFPSGSIDGGLGPRTDRALRRFQAYAGLSADGVAGAATRAALQRPSPSSPLRLRRPITAPLGDRFRFRGTRLHAGVDFPAVTGTLVTAAGAGRVRATGWDPGWGNFVVLEHAAGVRTLYAHLSSISVARNTYVNPGRGIGGVGSTGASTGPHLHFEVIVRGANVDPLSATG